MRFCLIKVRKEISEMVVWRLAARDRWGIALPNN